MDQTRTLSIIRSAIPEMVHTLVPAAVFEQYPHGSGWKVDTHAIRSVLEDTRRFQSLWKTEHLDTTMADACRCGLWLLFGELDRAHEICQRIERPEGSWWHAIVHRLDGDLWNSRYWYRQVCSHSAWDRAVEIARTCGLAPLPSADAIVTLVEEQGDCRQGNSDDYRYWSLCEWAGLYHHCHDQVTRKEETS